MQLSVQTAKLVNTKTNQVVEHVFHANPANIKMKLENIYARIVLRIISLTFQVVPRVCHAEKASTQQKLDKQRAYHVLLEGTDLNHPLAPMSVRNVPWDGNVQKKTKMI